MLDADRELARALVDRARDPEVDRELVEYEVAASLSANRSHGTGCAHTSTMRVADHRVCADCGAPQ
jgi:hypothetical protein